MRPRAARLLPSLLPSLFLVAVARGQEATKAPVEAPVDFLPLPDRWRIPFAEDPGALGQWWNPYGQNTLKGDYPIFSPVGGQDWFLALTVTSDTLAEWRQLPTASGVSTASPGSDPFFGNGDQVFVSQNVVASFELFQGDAAYRPRDLEIRITPVFNYTYLRTQEDNVVAIDPREGDTRRDHYVGLQEAFLEVHLADVSPTYDFVSTRVGVQGFTSDFRGFVFADNEPGVRLFGTARSNRDQWNLALFDFAEKDTNSGLVKISERRDQQLAVANWFVQDCFSPGWTHELSLHWNHDHGGEFEDDNGFPARPSRIGSANEHEIDTVYFGWASEGHVGWLNVSHAFYEVVGDDDGNPIAGRGVHVNAQLAALELSRDFDWLRPKVSLFYASGDDDPTDSHGTGFDSVFDNVNFAGGAFSFWNRQGIALTGTGVALVDRLSLLPHLRTSKLHDQANYVNPGILLVHGGLDAKVTQEVTLQTNLSWMRFAETDVLELALNDDRIRPDIGWDLSLGAVIRPWLTDNVIITAGSAWLFPGQGFSDIYGDATLYSGFVALTLTW